MLVEKKVVKDIKDMSHTGSNKENQCVVTLYDWGFIFPPLAGDHPNSRALIHAPSLTTSRAHSCVTPIHLNNKKDPQPTRADLLP